MRLALIPLTVGLLWPSVVLAMPPSYLKAPIIPNYPPQTDLPVQITPIDGQTLDGLIEAARRLKENEQSLRAGIPLSSFEDVGHQLQHFILQLKSFIMESYFDTFRFGIMKNQLAKTISEISFLGGNLVHGTGDVAQQYSFALVLFDTMCEAYYALKFYDHVEQPSQYLLNRIIDINVRILRLFNSHGRLDTDVEAYEEKVSEYHNSIWFWRRAFLRLEGVSQEDRAYFINQASRAVATLNILWLQVEKNNNYG
ncbi:hypothetical protein JCM33374_g4222 [Metschnikowia sp. JCM 33374]|nr:hypothetical protein JCM33374_g4222 [Metschnikowia sp. JCM 33374]